MCVQQCTASLLSHIYQYVKCNPIRYVDDTCLVSQHKDINKNEKQIYEDFKKNCGRFIDNKLNIEFGDDKTNSMFLVLNTT